MKRLALLLIVLPMSSSKAAEPNRPEKPLRIVVFGGHPDDPESGAGGLIATLTRSGHEVIVAYGTAFRGSRTFFGRPEVDVRRDEANAACKILGATPKFFPYAHESLNADEATLLDVASWFDEIKPDIVVTHWPIDTHPNHHVVSSLVWRSYRRGAGWNLYFFEVMTDRQTLAFKPELYLDIAPVRDLKREALSAHKSQGPDDIWASHETMHKQRGLEAGVTYAEAYSLVEPKSGRPLLPVSFLARKRPPESSRIDRTAEGFLVHPIQSEYQKGTTSIRVLVPDHPPAERRLPVIYVLPVEARDERRYGDGLVEVRKNDLHNRFQAIFVAPTFSDLPWYADHPTDLGIRQESYMLKTVIPYVESNYPAMMTQDGRLLLGFSKSGWGAFSLLLRHPDVFGKAAAWDAPFMQDRPDRYGMGPIFGTRENFQDYRIPKQLELRIGALGIRERLLVLGHGNFHDEHKRIHAFMVDRGISHHYIDGPLREHTWHSGWVDEAAAWLVTPSTR